jgi:hypothetical protein
MDSTTKILICRLAGEEYPHLAVPSSMDYCADCGQSVWRANSSPAAQKVLCTKCALKLGNELKLEDLSEEQQEELGQYYRNHPGEVRNDVLKAFESVSDSDLEDIPDLCVVIERLLDHLRELRRTAPKQFFDQPVERLYDSLEASLSSFYRAGVSGQRGEG